MALSPVLYVGFIGVTSRVASLGEVVFEGDPPGFAERLEAYRPFVLASAELDAGDDPGAVRRLIQEASKDLPVLESTRFGVTSDEDVRSPIVRAQHRAFEALDRQLRSLNEGGRAAECVSLAVQAFAIADLLRLSDSLSLSRSTGFQVSLVNTIRQHLPRLRADDLERIVNQLLAYEARRRQLRSLLRNELHLLVVESNFWTPPARRKEALKLAIQAMKAALAGDSILRFVRQASEIPHERTREDVCRTLTAWEVAMKSEDQSQRAIRSLIVEARSRQLAMRGERFDSQELLRLPKQIFGQTIHRRSPKLVVGKDHAYLAFGKPEDGIVAIR